MSKGRVVKHIGVVGSRHRSVTSRWGVLPYESSCEPRYKELALFHEDCGSHWGAAVWKKMRLRRVCQGELGSYVQAGGDSCLDIQKVTLAGLGDVA